MEQKKPKKGKKQKIRNGFLLLRFLIKNIGILSNGKLNKKRVKYKHRKRIN